MEPAEKRAPRLTLQILLLFLLAAALLACSFPYLVLNLLKEPTLTPTPSETGTCTLSPSPSATASPSDTLPPGTLPPATETLTPTNTPPTPQSGAIVYTPMSALSAPNLIDPKTTSGKMRPYYQWSPVPNATIYTIWVWQLNKEGEKRDLVINEQHLADHVCSPTLCQIRPDVELITDKQYTWLVQAYGPPGYSPFSSQFTFTAARITETPEPSGICPIQYLGKFGGGTVNAVAVAEITAGAYPGTYAYIGDGSIFKVLDVTTPLKPVEKGKITLGAVINGIEVNKDNPRYVYIAAGSAGVRILDVSDPAAPAQIGSYPTANDARSVIYNKDISNTLFVADGTNGIRVLSVTDPQNPTLITSADTPGVAKDIDVTIISSVAYVYLADYNQGVRYYKYQGSTLSERGGDNSYLKNANSIVVERTSSTPYYVLLADVSNGVVRAELDPVETPIPTVTPPVYNRIGDQFAAVDIEIDYTKGYSYAVGGSHLLITENNTSTYYSNSTLLNDSRDISIHPSDNYAYVADGTYGLKIIDISSPSSLSLLGTYDTSIVAYDVIAADNYAYVADYNGRLVKLSLLTPEAPALDSSANPRAGCATGNPYAVTIDGINAYVAANDGGLQIINRSFPTQSPPDDPVPVLECLNGYNVCVNNSGFAKDVAIPENSNIFVACNDKGLSYMNDGSWNFKNVPDPSSSVPFPGLANGLKVSDPYVYIAAYQKGLQIINLANTAATPVPFPSSGTVGDNYQDLALYGSYVMAVAGSAGLQIIDVSTPSAPEFVTSLDTPGNAVNIVTAGKAAFIADSANGVVVVDISDPSEPKIMCSYNTDGSARAVYVSDPYIYVADENNGMLVLEMYTGLE